MRCIIYVWCLCTIICHGTSIEIQPTPDATAKQDSPPKTDSIPILVGTQPKIEFPSKETDVSTPILYGDNPKKSNLPPRIFPKKQEKELANPAIVSDVNVNSETKHHEESNLNVTDVKILQKSMLENITNRQTTEEPKSEKAHSEQEDMLQSKYKGGQDVDELHPVKNVNENNADPKSQVSVSPTMDKNGPKSMNETKVKPRESMLESTSKMMAVSSSVLANNQPEHNGIIEPGKTIMTLLLTTVAIACLGAVGLLLWKRIAMRRFGRDVLINEDDFDEVADMHTFERAQIQIT
ncbi:uncharacterized protein LOC128987294 [Macrosteles quadrilineatus]|uniref:uncharacterized protein LOC128987294 n=1 Tax=Macrosteles quadrilineatus TaxID=74068 RepID=UPI0023E2F3D9|nr:uncharacterized protein LOC128987294 [Macrosteles quadrilineatus]